jgi:RNA-splicing ligase RtcB
MLELKGTCRSAKIFAVDIEHSALEQIRNVVNHPAFAGQTIRVMPDVHAGAGCVIGFTSTFGDKVVPNIVGVDIGCGVAAWKLPGASVEFEELQDFIRHRIPYGSGTRERTADDFEELAEKMAERLAESDRSVPDEGLRRYGVEIARLRRIAGFIERTCASTKQETDYVFRSIGTLGGGNHFIEVDRDDSGALWLTVHSGSRNFGLKVANFHQAKAREKKGKMGGLEYLEGEDTREYLEDMETAQAYARLNRYVMGHRILSRFFGMSPREIDEAEDVESVHNYISTSDGIIRKGAISAMADEKLIIPWNMRDGLVLGVGKGNPDWNSSAPHGAGRRMSRSEAKEKLSLDRFEKTMAGIWSRTVNKATIDEAPFAYKNHEEIERAIEPAVEIRLVLKPVYNFKDDSSGGGRRSRGRRSGGQRSGRQAKRSPKSRKRGKKRRG